MSLPQLNSVLTINHLPASACSCTTFKQTADAVSLHASKSTAHSEIPTEQTLRLLLEGETRLRGRLSRGSNVVYLVDLQMNGLTAEAVYKPVLGERPLWDFPSDLSYRERGAFLVDKALGWNVVPPTVLRKDMPFGLGSVQLFMPSDHKHHYFTMIANDHLRPRLERICALDIVINNADRKAGHCLLDDNGRVWAIDNGLTFHHDLKLRTVIWDFANNEIPSSIQHDLQRLLDDGLPDQLKRTLTPVELEATLKRTRGLLLAGHFPTMSRSLGSLPWSLV